MVTCNADIYVIKKKLLILISLIFIFSESLIFLSGERSAFFFMNLSAIYPIEYRAVVGPKIGRTK